MLRRLKNFIVSTGTVFNLAVYNELNYILKTRIERIIFFWVPLLAILIIWWVFYPGAIRNIPIGVLDYSQSYYSREFVRLADASPNIEVINHYSDALKAQKALNNLEVFAVIIIPDHFSTKIKSAQSNSVVLKVNGQYGTHSEIIKSAVSDVSMAFSTGVKMAVIEKTGVGAKYTKNLALPLLPSVKMDSNLELNYQKFLATALMPSILHILAAMAGAYTYGRNLRDKTLDDWYFSCSDKKSLVNFFFALNGKTFPALVILCFWGVLTIFITNSITFASIGNLITMSIAMIDMIYLSMWMGVFLTILLKSLRMGLSVSGFLTSPAFSFSGASFPSVAMPAAPHFISNCLPMSYFIKIQVGQLILHAPPIYAMNIIFWFGLIATILNLLSIVLGYILLNDPKKWGER